MQSKRELKKRITRNEALKVLLGTKREDLQLFEDSAIHIIVAENGALLVTSEGAEVFEFEEDNLKGLRELHYAIGDALGIFGSKYDRERIRHAIQHGDQYRCEDKDCPICHDEI